MAPTSQSDSFEPPSLAELAAMLPRYEFCDFIAQGGMGAVYLAKQASLERHVAVKVLPPMPQGEVDFAAHMTREAKSMARLTHNNIATVHDFGVTDDGWFYLVMEFVDGDTLHQLIRFNRLTMPKVRSIALQLCDALIFAHEHGILHRDIKPSNILINQDGRVKVVDFGLSRALNAQEQEVALGTPDYVAPEIMDGLKVDHRADVYALGVVIFEMLTGRVPWRHGSKIGAVLPEGGVWNEVVQKATHQSPDHRFRDVREMRAAILKATAPRREMPSRRTVSGRLMDGEPEPASKFRGLGNWGWLVKCAVLVMICLGGWLWWQRYAAKAAQQGDETSIVKSLLGQNGGVREVVESISHKLTEALESGSAVQAEGTVLAKMESKESLEIGQVPPGHVSQMQEVHEEPITDVALFPDGRRVVTASADGTVRIWDVVRGNAVLEFGPFENGVQRVAVSPDGQFVAAGGGRQQLWVWDAGSGEIKAQTKWQGRDLTALAFSADGDQLLNASTDMGASLRVWAWKEGKRQTSLQQWGKIVNALAVLPASGGDVGEVAQRFFTVGGGRDAAGVSMDLWLGDLSTGMPVKKLQARPMVPSRVVASRDGRLLAMTQGNRILVVDLEADRDIAACVGHEAMVESMQFLDGGRLLISGAQDKTIRIWETASGKEVSKFNSSTLSTSHLAVSADQRWLVAGGGMRWGSPPQRDGDYALHVWRLPELRELESEDRRLAKARQQFERLEEVDADLAGLRRTLLEEWKAVEARTNEMEAKLPKALDALGAKYSMALQRALPDLRGAAREAYLSEVSRVAKRLPAPEQAPNGWPAPLKQLFGIYVQEVSKLDSELRKLKANEGKRQREVVMALVRARQGAEMDAMALARAKVLENEVTQRAGLAAEVK